MNDNIFEMAFDAIDDELLADAKSPAIRIAVHRKKVMISSVAAALAAILIAIPSVKVMLDLNDNKFTESEKKTVICEVKTMYADTSSEDTSSETTTTESENQGTSGTMGTTGSGTTGNSSTNISNGSSSVGHNGITITVDDLYFTNNGTDGGTTAYTKVYVPDTKYLYINPLPTDKYITVYKGYYQNEINETEARTLADKYFPKIAGVLGVDVPQYKISTDTSSIPSIDVDSIFENSDHHGLSIDITNMQNRNIVYFSNFQNPVIINGETISINQNQNDNEIINSLSGLKQKLFDLFEVSFDGAKVIRYYDDYSDFGAGFIDVILYNSNSHALNDLCGDYPYTDYISITFDDFENRSTDTYFINNIWYWSYRTENHSHSKPVSEVELLPLETAENYLTLGYTLSVGGCPMCQAAQTPIDFTDYDYVSIEYKGGINIGDITLPYYAFYKNIGTAKNGNMTFAKTYVPAVYVEGYEEYFQNKHAGHSN